jgi:hypothetical protein
MNIPDSVKKKMIEDAKEYACVITEGGITLNNQLYAAFRDGQENGYGYSLANAGVWVETNPKENIRETYICIVRKREHGSTSIRPQYVEWFFNKWQFPIGHEEGWEVMKWLDESPSASKPNAGVSEEEIEKLAEDYKAIIDGLKHSWDRISEMRKTYAGLGSIEHGIKRAYYFLKDQSASKPKDLPTDKEVEQWFEDNIGTVNDCSASSAIYKFRLWLRDYFKKQDSPKDNELLEALKGVEKLAEEAAINEGYPMSDKTRFETTYWTQHNIYKEGFISGYKSKK